ncbi:MAG TPA: FtsQ-type POTRA domain-containing protein [Candidatus Limnocylindrales bacterium]|jgi:cell division septal protein FtsQ|nr:FtsQ-type POTRA domain-containing protein [Candidatus Limnocylindrales bacterium]
MSLPIRGRGRNRRSRPARASAARISRARLLGAAGVALAAVGAWLLAGGGVFSLAPGGLDLEGAHYTSAAQVRAALGLRPGQEPNLVTLHTTVAEAALRRLPAVDSGRSDGVEVRVILPDRLAVTLHERTPILVWATGGGRFLADTTGRLFAATPADGAVAAGLPEVDDRRATDARFGLGDTLDAVAFAAARRLGAVTPARIGSTAAGLHLTLDDEDGFSLSTAAGWRAVFGIYTPTIRPPGLVDRQIQCLGSLLRGREKMLETIYLAPSGDGCGTFTTRSAGDGG